MKLKTLFESAGRRVTKLLRAYLEECGINISSYEEHTISGFMAITRADKHVYLSIHDNGRIDVTSAEDRLLVKHRVFDFHDPDSFQKVEATIRNYLDIDAPGPRLPRYTIESREIGN